MVPEIRVGDMVRLKSRFAGQNTLEARVIGVHAMEGYPDTKQFLVEIKGNGLRVVATEDLELERGASG